MNESRWRLTFRPEGDGPETAIRIKKLLKIALRSCGLRCTDVAAVDSDSEIAPCLRRGGKKRLQFAEAKQQ
jgi:hypothetical protein